MVVPKNPDSSEGMNEEVTRAEEFRRQLKRAYNRPMWYLWRFRHFTGIVQSGSSPVPCLPVLAPCSMTFEFRFRLRTVFVKLRVSHAIESGVYHSLKRNHLHVLCAFSFPVALAYAYSYTSISYSGISRAPGASYGRKAYRGSCRVVSELKLFADCLTAFHSQSHLLRRHPQRKHQRECRGDGQRLVATALRKTKQTTHHQVFNSVQLALRAE